MQREPKRVILIYKGRAVGGFSIKTNQVYTFKEMEKAKKFTSAAANKFLQEHRESLELDEVCIKLRPYGVSWNEYFKKELWNNDPKGGNA